MAWGLAPWVAWAVDPWVAWVVVVDPWGAWVAWVADPWVAWGAARYLVGCRGQALVPQAAWGKALGRPCLVDHGVGWEPGPQFQP